MRKILLSLTLFLLASTTCTAANTVQVVMETNKGNITLELNPDKAPKTVANFLQYVDEGFYVNTIFHRVVKMNEMKVIQGGGFDTNYQYKNTRPPIINEADNGLKNERGTIAMARTLDEHSATSQFYINVMSHSFLDHSAKTPRGWGYAVFGKVVAGMDIVEAIWAIPTIPAGPFPQDVPRDPVIITRVYRAAAQPAAN